MYLKCKWANLLWKIRDNCKRITGPFLPPPDISDQALLSLSGGKFQDVNSLLSHFQQSQSYFIDASQKAAYIEHINRFYPQAKSAVLVQADRICRHVFDILGYKNIQLPPHIPWNSDLRLKHPPSPCPLPNTVVPRLIRELQTGEREHWSGYYLSIDPCGLDKETDIRITWELSGCQHWVTLGQAYWLSGEELYAQEFAAQLGHWLEANPTDWGANWVVSMEVAIRALNWIWAYYLFLDSPHFTPALRLKLIKSLVLHARHIRGNLEGHPYGEFGNHYITNGLGLLGLGIFLRDLQPAAAWIDTGLDILWRETLKQVYSDGVDCEGSINYHREVTEFLLAAIILCQKNSLTVPDEVFARVEKMLEFIGAYTRPDGSAPLIGDSDNGRLFKLEPDQPENDHHSSLSTGAAIFQRADFTAAAGNFYLESFWLTGMEGWQKFQEAGKKSGAVSVQGSRAFPKGGFYIMRSRDIHLVLRCGPYGKHGHNDILGLDLFVHNRPIIMDSGTYTYTGSWKWRNSFRSVYAHACAAVDEEEPQLLSKATIWDVGRENEYTIREWGSQSKYDFWEAEHYCYRRIGVTHRRQVLLDKDSQYVLLKDFLSGQGVHYLEFIFPLAARLRVEIVNNTLVRLHSADHPAMFSIVLLDKGLEPKLYPSWVSYVYGHKLSSQRLIFQITAQLPFSLSTLLCPGNPPADLEGFRHLNYL